MKRFDTSDDADADRSQAENQSGERTQSGGLDSCSRRTALKSGAALIGGGLFVEVGLTDAQPVEQVLEDGSTEDLSRYTGDMSWTSEAGSGGFSITTGSDVIEGDALIKATNAEHGGYHTMVTLDEIVQRGDTLSCKLYYPTQNTYTSVLFGVQSDSNPFPAYRFRLDNGGSPTISLEKVTADDPIETHNLPNNRILYSWEDEDNGKTEPYAGEVYRLEWDWTAEGKFPFTLYRSDGSVFHSANPDSDTEFSSGGIGFMHSTSNPREEPVESYWDRYVVLSSSSDGGGGGGTNETPTAADDSATVTKGKTVTIDVLSNDSDSNGSLNASTVTVVSEPANGSTAVSGGTIDYTHDGSDTQADSFGYTVDDDDGATSNEATVSITVDSNSSNGEQSPYGGSPVSLPGRIQAENFDQGGEGVAYHDADDGNTGGAYRDTNVDIQPTTDESGAYNVGWTENGEWLEYTIDAGAGEYDLNARLAGRNANARLRILLDATELTTFDVPDTDGWQTWTTKTHGPFSLDSGTRTLRLEIIDGNFNLNWIEFTPVDSDSGSGGDDGSDSGQRVEVTTNSSSNVTYIIESDGDIGAVENLESDDETNTSKAKGTVTSGDTDVYELSNGSITDVSTFDGDVTVTVDGTTWSG